MFFTVNSGEIGDSSEPTPAGAGVLAWLNRGDIGNAENMECFFL